MKEQFQVRKEMMEERLAEYVSQEIISFSVDIVTTIILIILCFFIFYKTKELYQLTEHEGVKYFRFTFLFFGLSFLIESLRFLVIFSVPFEIIAPIMIIALYAGTLAIICLLYSLVYKWFPWLKYSLATVCGVALLITVMSMIIVISGNSPLIVAVVQIIVFGTAIALAQSKNRQKNKRLPLHILYVLLFAAWILNVLSRFFWILDSTVVITLNIVSAILFAILTIKVLKGLGKKQ